MRHTSLLLVALAALAPAQDARRIAPIVPHKQIALVIGNAAYTAYPALRNSVNDARDISDRLRALHYDVTVATDLNRKAMALAIDQFLGHLSSGDVALFYYSGHGVQVEGENYLLPTDFDGRTEIDVKYDAQAAARIQERMEKSGAQLNIVILDACRSNAFKGATRGGERGLAAMTPSRGTFIAFATAPGSIASDNPNGRNGLFTQYLLDALGQPGFGLNDVFDLVREKVDAASGGKQLPWTQSSVVGRYSFVPVSPPAVVAPAIINAAPQPGQVKEKDGQRFVWIPPGKFMMGCSPGDTQCYGDESPAHEVEITRGFWLGQTAVTSGQWKRYRIAAGKPALSTEDSLGRKNLNEAGPDDMPAVFVTWDEGKGYCESYGGRLPTEAEWEYAARAGNTSARYGELDAIAWYGDNSGKQKIDSLDIWKKDHSNYSKRLFENGNGPRPVGRKEPNAWNLYDMLGNVWQWTADWYDEKYYNRKESRDPIGPPSGTQRTLRGGSWYYDPRVVRVSVRYGVEPGDRSSVIGARCVGN